MKTRYYILGLLSIATIFSACDKQLDLAPEDTIVEDKVFEKFSSTESAVAGTYHMLFSAATKDYNMAEATAPTCEYSSGAARTFDEINNGTVLPENTLLQGIYESYYAALVQANLLLYKIPELGQYNEAAMNQHMAEARFIRAYAYLRLLGWYGDGALLDQPQKDGVVLYLEHYNGFDRDTDIRPRNSNEEVYAQIILDLEEAIKALPEPGEQIELETRVSRANTATCEALLSRVYMFNRDYTQALEWADKVLARTEYYLADDLRKVFPLNPSDMPMSFSSEHIFGFPVSTNGGNWQFGGNNIYYNFNNYWYSNALISSFSDTDVRKTELMREEVYQGEVVYITDKYPNTNGRDNMTMMRLTEVVLSKAEAMARTSASVTQEMVDLLNDIHLRANPTEMAFTPGDFTSTEVFIERVLLERSKELAFEGFSRFDQLRTDRPLYNPELPDSKKVFPIPLREIQISNGVVKQNEGYTN
ncbi:RagB/SusD family nutrient uptake outer membrane protein [Carboxylicivirga sp. M1479]|uniref:RagB/SusD family nutrient uptake outer membrane protein n=1 Tax=Carboxylicivirga sp. M1479 TaxID=2594476 RepID=UPI00163D4EE0|nr:RagB/SusD family nutrient uptake outer membrane protein [Carboxylicivirga sp. M1479]